MSIPARQGERIREAMARRPMASRSALDAWERSAGSEAVGICLALDALGRAEIFEGMMRAAAARARAGLQVKWVGTDWPGGAMAVDAAGGSILLSDKRVGAMPAEPARVPWDELAAMALGVVAFGPGCGRFGSRPAALAFFEAAPERAAWFEAGEEARAIEAELSGASAAPKAAAMRI